MYSYGQVEAALAAVHRIPPKAVGAFKGRIKHFQRIGIVPASPGKGKRIDYSLTDVYLWGFCLEFAEFGMDPVTIKKIAVRVWNYVYYEAFGPERDSDRYFFFHPAILGKDFPAELAQSIEAPDGAPNSYSFLIDSDLHAGLDRSAKTPQDKEIASRFRARYVAINLSRLRRDIDFALGGA
jgi:hypothetical protein